MTPKTKPLAGFLAAAVLSLLSLVLFGQNSTIETVRVISLPGRPLPVVAAQTQGILARYGLRVEAEAAPNSDVLRNALASGKADVAHAAVDNAVAMADSGAADVVIVIGGEYTLNELIAQPDIHSIAQLRGRTLIVDAPNTAYALQLKKMLRAQGLEAAKDYELKSVGGTPLRLKAMRENKSYAASMLGPPTSLVAKKEGFVGLGLAEEVVGRSQAAGAFVRRDWAQAHADTLVRYLAAYVEAQRWLIAPENKDKVIELMAKESDIPVDVARETYAVSMGPRGGYQQDARFDLDAFNNVLRLRAEIEGQPGAPLPNPEKYYDPTFYRRALSSLGSSVSVVPNKK